LRFRQFRLSLVEENQLLNSVLGSDDRRVAHVMDRRARARPFAASKLAAVVVAIVALGTADAATLLGYPAGYQYTTSTDTSYEEALSVAISGFDWSTFTASDYTADIANHVVDFYFTTWNLFLTHYGNGSPDAVVKDYIDGALVSPDFKTENPKKPVSLDKETRP
jgi:hypothetical protein